MTRVVAIVPKKRVRTEQLQQGVTNSLKEFGRDLANEMSKYPPDRPWRSRTPKSGPRAGGRRTGQYGDGWRNSVRLSTSSVTLVNPVPYSNVIGGRGQTKVAKSRGWKRVDEVAPLLIQKQLGKLANLIIPR